MRRIIKERRLDYFKVKIDKAAINNYTVMFGLNDMSIDWAKAEFNLELHYLSELLSHELYMLQALKNDGMTDTEIEDVVKGKYKKGSDDVKPVLGVVDKTDGTKEI